MNKVNLEKVIRNFENETFGQCFISIGNAKGSYCAAGVFFKTLADDTGELKEINLKPEFLSGGISDKSVFVHTYDKTAGASWNSLAKWLDMEMSPVVTIDETLLKEFNICSPFGLNDKVEVIYLNDVLKLSFKRIGELLRKEYLT